MNPYVNFYLDDSTIIPQRLLDNNQLHSTCPLGGAVALNPYTSQQGTLQTDLYEPRQDGFSEAPQVFHGTEEKLDDVSTWGIDTIRQVATDLYHNPRMTLSGHHNKFDDASTETFRQTTVQSDDEYHDENSVGAYGGVGHRHEPICSDTSTTCYNSPLQSRIAGSRPRKVKMHEWQPQSNPELEKRRRGAKRQWEQRQKEREEVEGLQNELLDINSEIAQLIPEADMLRQRVQMLERYAAEHDC